MRESVGQEKGGLKIRVFNIMPFDFSLLLIHFSSPNIYKFFKLSAGKILFYFAIRLSSPLFPLREFQAKIICFWEERLPR